MGGPYPAIRLSCDDALYRPDGRGRQPQAEMPIDRSHRTDRLGTKSRNCTWQIGSTNPSQRSAAICGACLPASGCFSAGQSFRMPPIRLRDVLAPVAQMARPHRAAWHVAQDDIGIVILGIASVIMCHSVGSLWWSQRQPPVR